MIIRFLKPYAKKINLVFFLSVASFLNLANGQAFDGIRVSFKGGVLYSEINDLERTILSESFFINYAMKTNRVTGYTGGLGINWEIKNSVVALKLDLMYAQQGSELIFENFERDFNYKMEFGYQFLNIPLQLKVYPFKRLHRGLDGFNLGAGALLGLNLTPNNIIYTSSGTGKLPEFGTDLQQQQQIRNVLKGQNNFGLNFQVGYEIRGVGLYLEASYFHGLTDVVRTEANAYNFVENDNTNQALQITIGWEFFSSYPRKYVLFVREPRS